MAHTPLKLTIPQAHAEVNYGWADAYSPQAIAKAVASLERQLVGFTLTFSSRVSCFAEFTFR
jgi:hypothetical protein